MKIWLIGSFIAYFFLPQQCCSQEQANKTCCLSRSIDSLPIFLSKPKAKTFEEIGKKYSRLNKLIEAGTRKMLNRMERKELKLQQIVRQTDTAKANILFSNSYQQYEQLHHRLQLPCDIQQNQIKEYMPGLDSIQTAFRFLEKSEVNILGLSPDGMHQLQLASVQTQHLQARFQQSCEVQQFIKERERQLSDQLTGSDLGKNLSGINKEAYYAQQQLVQYKELIKDQNRLERQVLADLKKVPAFEEFMQKNSYLGQLFGLPDNYGSTAALAGLQTRVQLDQLVGQRIGGNIAGGNSVDPAAFVNGQMHLVKQMIDQLKERIHSLGATGASGDATMPNFKPNNQKTRPFLKRMEYGFNIQTQKSSLLVPAAAGFSVIVGYKVTDRSAVGLGGVYHLGLGNGLKNFSFSSQGVGFRSYVDIYLKGSVGISGGAEYNYFNLFKEWPSVRKPDIWQKSVLIGIIKKTKVSGNKNATTQLLFDGLYKQHIPNSSPIVFRMGYKFNK